MMESGLLWWIPLLPLIGAFVSGAFGLRLQRRFGERAVAAVSVGLPWLAFFAAAASLVRLLSADDVGALGSRLWTWVAVGGLKVEFFLRMDRLSGMMAAMVTLVGSLIHVYSIGYMKKDEGFWRFFAFLNLFLFAMLTLVLAGNLLLLFVGWEGVGLCSYLLIGFWYRDLANARAGMKAFVVNRIGDFGFLLGMCVLFWGLGGAWDEAGYRAGEFFSLDFAELPRLLAGAAQRTLWGVPVPTLAGVLFFVGACGKSAQIPLYVWLPDAMAGPTPVSALIHAATMVTAGVYLVARLNFLYLASPTAMTVVALVGALTAVFAATIGCVQNDIKKVLAYSTISQLGYMFVGVGVGAFWAGSYHLLTHAFFKACLFLGAGSVILAMHHEQDMQKMGGLGRVMPFTRWTYWYACVAITGLPLASGFFSKDEILWQAFNTAGLGVPGWFLWLLLFLGAGLTSFYMWRSYFLTFTGPTVKIHGEEPEEQRPVITGVLAVLAVGAGVLMFIGLPEVWLGAPPAFAQYMEPVFRHGALAKVYGAGDGHGVELGLMAASVAVALAGLGLAAWFYRGRRSTVPERLRAALPRLHRLVQDKYYVDEGYQAAVVEPALTLSRAAAWFDSRIVDGLVNLCGGVTRLIAFFDGAIDKYLVDGVVNGLALLVRSAGAAARRWQTGRLSNYLGGLAFGTLVLIALVRLIAALLGE